MSELIAGIVGGFGLFIVGMWLLTENLKALTTRRLRSNAGRLTENRFSALAWGTLAGAITQSMSAMTFIVMSLLRSGLITPIRGQTSKPILLIPESHPAMRRR